MIWRYAIFKHGCPRPVDEALGLRPANAGEPDIEREP
jgi:hypothetical protein